MTIEKINNDAALDATRQTQARASIRESKEIGNTEANTRDGADVSKLSKIVARGTQDLSSDFSVRPEKIAAFKSIVNKHINLTDKQIDTIIDKIVDN